jgi:hypothetical protein
LANAGLQEALKYNEKDAELWGLISDVPSLSLIPAVVCAILNVGLAGSGTLISGVLAGEGWNKTQMFIGFI